MNEGGLDIAYPSLAYGRYSTKTFWKEELAGAEVCGTEYRGSDMVFGDAVLVEDSDFITASSLVEP
jgi:hypothetical protein